MHEVTRLQYLERKSEYLTEIEVIAQSLFTWSPLFGLVLLRLSRNTYLYYDLFWSSFAQIGKIRINAGI